MATPKVLLKRSSVVGRVPTASDLDYGEVAINFADGKLYYKDDSNNIRAFIDSARVQAIADAVEVVADAQLDSGETTILVTSLIDSNYVQSRTNETYLATIIDSAYVQARQADIFRDSNYITNTIAGNLSLGQIIRGLDPGVNAVENPSDFTQTMTSQITAGSGISLSGGSGWGTPLQISATGTGGIDSASVIALIDSDHIQNRQIKYTTADFADSDGVTNIVQGIVTASYVRARQKLYTTADFPDSAFVTGQGYLTAATTTTLVDSAYVRNRVRTNQDLRTTDSVEFSGLTVSGDFTVTGTTTSVNTIVYTTNDPLIHLADSNEQSDVVDIGHIGHYYRNGQRRHTGLFRDASNEEYYIFNNMIDSAFDSVLPPNVINRNATDFQLATVNVGTLVGVYAGFDSDFNAKSTTNLSEGTNLYYTKARADSDIAASLTDSTNTVTITITNTITDQVDSAYVLARVAEAPFLDSYYTTELIDSAYIRLHTRIGDSDIDFGSNKILYSNVYSTEGDLPSASTYHGMFAHVHGTGAGYFAHAGNWTRLANQSEIFDGAYGSLTGTPALIDSSLTIQLIDSAYVQARQTAGTDSAATIALIQSTVDSAYVQLREDASGGGTGTVDSAYVIEIVGERVGGLYQQTSFRYTVDSGQTVITGVDGFGQTLNYEADMIDVFLNGVLIVDSDDYTQTSSSTLTIASPLDSGDEISIIYRRGSLVTPSTVTYEYTATAGQSTFTGVAANGKSLAYSPGAVHVFKQGLLLKSGTDYTANNGSSVVLTSGATVSDKIAIAAYATPHAKATSFNFTADSNQAVFNGKDNSGNTLSYEPANSLVFLNGISLGDSDFTAINGTSVTLVTAANLNDELKVVSFGAVTTNQSSNNWSETSTSIKISPNEKKFVDVSSAAVTLEIQDSGSNVSMGDELRIIDGYGTAASNNITLRSTKKIIGSDSDFIIDINRAGTNLVYYNESNGWVLIEN